MALSFIIFPLVFGPMMFMGENGFSDFAAEAGAVFAGGFFFLFLFLGLVSYALYGVGSSALVLGVMRVESGTERLTFGELFNDSKPYWMRVLGVMLLIGLTVGLVFTVIFGCLALFGAVTLVGFICVTPLMLVMYPLMLVLYGIIEESQVAVVASDLNVTDAIRRGWELVRDNFWGVFLASLVGYLGVTLLSSVLMVPMMMPSFAIPFMMDTQGTTPDPRTMMTLLTGFMCIFFPVMALVQGIGITFLKTTYTLIYIRVVKPVSDNTPMSIEADV